MTSWKITVDHMPDLSRPPGTNANAVGVCGPRGGNWNQPMPFLFRMLDDDGNLLYEGVSSAEDFAPLDDFGMPNAGCTRIEYRTPRGAYMAI